MINTVIIDESMLKNIKMIGNLSPDKEVCGIIKGKKIGNDIVICKEIIQITNMTDEKIQIVDYMMEPQELMDVLKDTSFINKESKDDFVAIWHTHPRGSSKPSSIDLNRAEYDVAYIIFGRGTDTIQSWAFKKLGEARGFKEAQIIDLEDFKKVL